ncbi:MAG: bifunctional DNA-formamidopyrimidine glycosylase/DNA-(apurinic or apyrimidinic site) lyase [Syntrophomonadaceae bacterium]|jgi:formamidopyrimidine-DNA glycosylase|nr:bifunctional DNA-formamidopyrimidine glycosylase/DNA-(apurinic or apyrimidinic site) lyase [Bacillota bacterium]
MPELPEVETIRRSILGNENAILVKIDIFHPGILRRQDFDPAELYGQPIRRIARRGKFLVFFMQEERHIIVHLGMSGRFYMIEKGQELSGKHIHAVLHLDNGRRLVYQDARRFGGLRFVIDIEDFFCRMGCEPLEDEFNADLLAKLVKDRKVAIKTLMLNQNLIAGIGNIYADEALFAAGILPQRPAGSLTTVEVERLTQAIKQVLNESIEQRGTTFRDFRDGYNKSGGFQHHLQVYGRINEPCRLCGRPLARERIGGRSSHYCRHCQS